MFVLGAGTIAVAATGDMKLWAFYVSVVLIGAKVAAFGVQYAGVSRPRRQPDPRRRPRLIAATTLLGTGRKMRYTAARACPVPEPFRFCEATREES